MNGTTILLDLDGGHRRENVAHVFRASGAAVPGPAKNPALRMARSSGQRPMASGTPWPVSRTTRHCPTKPYGSRFTGPGTPNPPGWTPRNPHTRHCASICAAQRTWGNLTRPPNRRRRPRGTRAPPSGPRVRLCRAAPGHPCLTPSVSAAVGRGREGGGGGGFSGLWGHWDARTSGRGAAATRDSATTNHALLRDTRRKPAAL